MVILDFSWGHDWETTRPDGSPWEEIDKHLCPLAKQFKDARPGKEMRVILAGYYPSWKSRKYRDRLQRTWMDNRFIMMPDLMKEAEVRIRFI